LSKSGGRDRAFPTPNELLPRKLESTYTAEHSGGSASWPNQEASARSEAPGEASTQHCGRGGLDAASLPLGVDLRTSKPPSRSLLVHSRLTSPAGVPSSFRTPPFTWIWARRPRQELAQRLDERNLIACCQQTNRSTHPHTPPPARRPCPGITVTIT